MTALAMILATAERHPDRVAIEEADGRAVTYRALVARDRFDDPDIAMAHLAFARLHASGDRARAFDLFLATGADFAVEHTHARLAELGVRAPEVRLDAIVAAALQGAS